MKTQTGARSHNGTSPPDLNAAHVTRCNRKSNGYPELAAIEALGAPYFERVHQKLAATLGSRELP